MVIPMNDSIPGKGRFSNRDRKIIEHVARYRLTIIEVLCRRVLPGLSPNAVAKIANRLCRSGYLRKFTLLHPTRYFVLDTRGAQWLSPNSDRTGPLGPQSLPMEYAVLVYATLGKRLHTRLTAKELLLEHPWLTATLANAPHCRDDQDGILELVRVDLGGPADHVARKCTTDMNKRWPLHEFLPLVKQGRFRLVVITATSEKVNALRQAMEAREWPPGLRIHFSVIPQLLSLTASKNHA
jgi:hypothetical protein